MQILVVYGCIATYTKRLQWVGDRDGEPLSAALRSTPTAFTPTSRIYTTAAFPCGDLHFPLDFPRCGIAASSPLTATETSNHPHIRLITFQCGKLVITQQAANIHAAEIHPVSPVGGGSRRWGWKGMQREVRKGAKERREEEL